MNPIIVVSIPRKVRSDPMKENPLREFLSLIAAFIIGYYANKKRAFDVPNIISVGVMMLSAEAVLYFHFIIY